MPNSSPPKRSLLDRIFCTESLLALLGVCLVVMGLGTGFLPGIFFGSVALVGLTALYFIRKKDWKAHWESMERLQGESDKPAQKSDSDK